MTKKERVIAAINNKEVSGIPSSFSLHFPQDKKMGEECVKAHLKFFEETDTDICKIMNENLIPVFSDISLYKSGIMPLYTFLSLS